MCLFQDIYLYTFSYSMCSFIPYFYMPKTCNYLGTLKKKKNTFALLLAAVWGTSLMDIPSERNMKFKGIAKMGNYQKRPILLQRKNKILCAPYNFCLSTQPKDIWANKSPSSSSRHSAAADKLLGLPQTYLKPGTLLPPTGL